MSHDERTNKVITNERSSVHFTRIQIFNNGFETFKKIPLDSAWKNATLRHNKRGKKVITNERKEFGSYPFSYKFSSRKRCFI